MAGVRQRAKSRRSPTAIDEFPRSPSHSATCKSIGCGAGVNMKTSTKRRLSAVLIAITAAALPTVAGSCSAATSRPPTGAQEIR